MNVARIRGNGRGRAFVLLAAAVTLTICPGVSPAQEPPTYRIAAVPWAGWSPLDVAEAKGFWRDQGIEVQVASYDYPALLVEAIKAGQTDLAMEMVGTMVGRYLLGEPAMILGETDWSHGGDKIILREGEAVAQHKGGIIGVFVEYPSCLYFLEQFLASQGTTLADFRVVEVRPDALTAQFIAGRIPIILNYDPHALRAVEEGHGRVAATSASFPGCVPECLWGYRAQIESIPADDLRKVLRGWIRAVLWAKDPQNWPELQQILNQRTFRSCPAYSEEELRGFMEAVRIHSPEQLLERNRPGGGLETYLTSLRAFLESNDMLTKDYREEDVFDGTFLLEALKEDFGAASGLGEAAIPASPAVPE